MNEYEFQFCGTRLHALPDGALFAPDAGWLAVSDLHLGKSDRIARREGRLTPPYETMETLARLASIIDELQPNMVISLGDSFDDQLAAEALPEAAYTHLSRLMAGRRWVWILGNHDPTPSSLGGAYHAELRLDALTFRHIATAKPCDEGEISGHYHPKSRIRGRARPVFLVDKSKIIMPAFGVYTGGMDCTDPVFDNLMSENALALFTGPRVVPAPRKALRSVR
ncbi:MAG: ligase-associated DNA damage response endonuclease PdeM [Pikeienuella sp.]